MQFNDEIISLGQNFHLQAVTYFPKILVGLTVFIIFYIFARLSKFIISKSLKKITHHFLATLFAKTASIAIITLGLVTALGTMGINVNAIIASLGLLGFAVGFALKDFLSNTLAGVMILFYKPFNKSDLISGTNFSGKVIEINLRYTIVEADDKITLIPNATMLNNVVNVDKKE